MDLDDIPKEPARKKANRVWANHDIERRFKEARSKFASDDPSNPFMTLYGKKEQPTTPSACTVHTNDADEIEKQRKRHQKRRAKLILEIINQGRSTITAPELKDGIKRQSILVARKHHLQRQKRKLLLEKYRRLLEGRLKHLEMAQQER